MSNQDKERSGIVPGAEDRRPIIEMQGIRKSYYVGQPGELEILHGINLTVYAGEFVALADECERVLTLLDGCIIEDRKGRGVHVG